MISLSAPPVITITKTGTEHITSTSARAYVNAHLDKPLKIARTEWNDRTIETVYIRRDDSEKLIRINLTPTGIEFCLRFSEIQDSGRAAGAGTNFQRTR